MRIDELIPGEGRLVVHVDYGVKIALELGLRHTRKILLNRCDNDSPMMIDDVIFATVVRVISNLVDTSCEKSENNVVEDACTIVAMTTCIR